MVKRLTELVVEEVSLVDNPANEDARVVLFKHDTGEQPHATGDGALDAHDDAVGRIHKAQAGIEAEFDDIVRQHRLDGETFEKAYARILDNEIGRTFYAKRDELRRETAVVRKLQSDALRA